MKYWQPYFFVPVLCILFFISGCIEHNEVLSPTTTTETQSLAKSVTGDRYLVGFKNTPETGIITGVGGEVDRTFSIIPAVAARMSPQAADALSRNPNIRYVEPDYTMYAHSQTLPWGIDRVFGDESYSFPTWNTSTGSVIEVAILDTGIDENHEDLTVVGGTTTVDNTHWGNDGSGHGTHVAGTVAALDNEIGVVGVAPDVSLYAVKVLSDGGSGTVSSVVAGIEWAVQENIPVLNMSLGGSSDSQTLRDACDAAYAAGHLLVASAGNSGNPGGRGDNVGYPARYESVIAVASSTINDTRSSFSSTGPDVELIAPGSSILSTLPGDDYGTYSGTSMASPHVAGVAALAWAANSSLSHTEVRQILRDTAEDLGLSSNHQGYGLARADLAVAAATGAEPVPTGNIAGTVTDAVSGSGIGGALVTVEGTNFSATTSSDGSYSINDIPEGTYDVTASADGYVAGTQQGTVSGNTTTTLNFALDPESDDDPGDPVNGELSIDEFELTDASNPRWARVTVTWAVSGENLSSVQSELILDGNVVDSQTSSVSGSGAQGEHSLRNRDGHGNTYQVTLTVTDADGNSISETKDIVL